MARLAAVAKGLFYPTPDRVARLIASAVSDPPPLGGRLLDPCAGEGVAAEVLARAWGLDAYGVELHEGRALAAASRMKRCLRGSYHQLAAPDGSFSVLFLNPPYDLGEEGRMEVEFLRETGRLLAPGGLLVFVPPRHVLELEALRALMRDYREVEVLDFPEPERAAFDQVVVLARRSRPLPPGSYGYGYYPSLCTEAPRVLGDPGVSYAGLGEVAALPEPFSFEFRGECPHDLAPGPAGGCRRLRQWKILLEKDDLLELRRPLVAPRSGHVAMLLAAGALDGTELPGGKIVKGSSEKIVVESKDEDAGLVFKREKIVSRLSVLQVTTGKLESWRTDEDPEGTRRWFEEHGPALAASVRRDHPPLYDGSLEGLDFSGVRAPGLLPGMRVPTILDAQKRGAAAVAECWKRRNSAVVSGEMGVGKAQRLSAPVLTPHGWVALGSLRVGDAVIDPTTGGMAKVRGIFPQGRKQVFRVTFSDGSTAECCDDHLWEVNTPLRRWSGAPA